MESILCWPTTLSMGPALECDDILHSIGGNWSSISQLVSIANNFLVRVGALYHVPFSVLGYFLTWTCVRQMHTVFRSSYEHQHREDTVVLEPLTHQLWLLQSCCLLFCIVLWTLRFTLRTECAKGSYSVHSLVVGHHDELILCQTQETSSGHKSAAMHKNLLQLWKYTPNLWKPKLEQIPGWIRELSTQFHPLLWSDWQLRAVQKGRVSFFWKCSLC